MPQQTNPLTKPIVWTVASSDSGGGAGIQADLHSFKALECHGCSVIAAITAQNSVGITAYECVSPALFLAQLNCLLEDMPPQVIKIGLIPNSNLLAQLSLWLTQHKSAYQFKVVADPVFSSSTGACFIEQGLLTIWRQQLLPLIDLITPNLPELALFSDLPKQSIAQQVTQLFAWGATAVLVTGGHDTSTLDVIDRLYIDKSELTTQPILSLYNPRLNTVHTHGTGCVLASSIAAALAQDYPLTDAVILGNASVQQALSAAYATGKGAGCVQLNSWPVKVESFPRLNVRDNLTSTAPFAAMQRPIGLYPVVDNSDWLQDLAPYGADTLQLRIKAGSNMEIEQQITTAVALSRKHNLRLFINDYWQLAIKHNAYGVHLGQEDLQTADLEAIRTAGLRLGVSTHSYLELLTAIELQPSYIALGHIFATDTKKMPSKPQGLVKLARYASLCQHIPTVAIGGINEGRLLAVLSTGVDGVAVVSAITTQPQPAQAFIQLKRLIEQHASENYNANYA